MIAAPIIILCTEVGRTSSNWSKNTKYGWKMDAFNGESWTSFRKSFTILFSWFVSVMLRAWTKRRVAMIFVPSSLNFTSREYVLPANSHCENEEKIINYLCRKWQKSFKFVPYLFQWCNKLFFRWNRNIRFLWILFHDRQKWSQPTFCVQRVRNVWRALQLSCKFFILILNPLEKIRKQWIAAHPKGNYSIEGKSLTISE